MATNLITAGTGAATSPEMTVAEGGVANVFLYNSTNPGAISVQIKRPDNGWVTVAVMGFGNSNMALPGPGTYRLTRAANSPAIGAFRG